MKNLKVKRNSIIVLFLTLFMFYILIKDNFNNIISVLQTSKFEWIILGFLVFLFSILIESIVLKRITNRYKEKYSLKKAFDLNMITKFFNGITPSSSGGQPFQVYELTKQGIKVSDSTNVVIEFFLVYQASLIIISGICYIINIFFNIVQFNSTLTLLFYLGLILNTFTLVFAVIIGRSKRISKKILVFMTKVLAKLRIVKNRKKWLDKVEVSCNEFYLGYKEMNKDKLFLFRCITIQIIALIIRFSVSLFIFKALELSDQIIFIECLVTSIFVFLSGSYIPIPGGTGGMEYAYYGFFSKFIIGAALNSCLIIWRLISFIIPVLIGGVIFNISSSKRK